MNRSDLLRLVNEEVALNAFFHASHEPLPVGEVLVSAGSATSTPSLLDAVRPAGASKRGDYLFMVDDLRCLEELGQSIEDQHVYRVSPVDSAIKTNFAWIERLFDIAADSPDYKSDPRAVRAALKYWSGNVPRGKECKTEYLTKSFRVDEEVLHSSHASR